MVPSPCINVCKMDDTTGGRSGWCTGCLRTLDEIARWSQLDDADKQAVWQQLPQRRVQWLARQSNPPAQAPE